MTAAVLTGCVTPQDAAYGIKPMELTDVGGHVDLVARQRERDQESKVSRGETRSRETIFEESLTLETDGFMLHPNLIEFGLGATFGLVQEQFEDVVDRRERDTQNSGDLLEFDAELRLFKKRPTPLTLFAHRRRGLVPRPFLTSLETTTTSYGFNWQYVSEKVPTSLQFNHTEASLDPLFTGGDVERGGTQKNTELTFETAYRFSDHHKLSFDYQRQAVEEDPFELSYDADEANLTHHLEFGDEHQHHLRSTLHSYDQRGTIDIRRARWREDLRLEHSDRLESRYEFEALDRTRGNRSPDLPDIEERAFRASASLRHKLFESQTLQLRVFGHQQEFEPDLRIIRWGGQAHLNYRKKNPWGVLYADYSFRAERTERDGADQSAEIVDETQTFRDPEPVVLGNPNVVVDSISIRGQDRVTFYRQGRDYTLRTVGELVEVHRVPTGNIPDGGTVLIDYVFTRRGNFDLDTVRHHAGVRQDFDFGLLPYYRFEWQDQTLSPPDARGGLAEDITAHVVGVEYRRESLRLFAEYEDHDSTINPFRSSRYGASYTHRFRSGAQTSVFARWTDTTHRAPNERKVRLMTLEGRHRHPITRNLTLEGSVLYRNGEDSASRDTEGVDLSVSLEWFVRATEIRVSFQQSEYEDDFTRNDSSSLFVHVRRKF